MDRPNLKSVNNLSEEERKALTNDLIQTKLCSYQLSHKYGMATQRSILIFAREILGDLFESREQLALITLLKEIYRLVKDGRGLACICKKFGISNHFGYKIIRQFSHPTTKYCIENGTLLKSADGMYLPTLILHYNNDIPQNNKEHELADTQGSYVCSEKLKPFSFIDVIDDAQSETTPLADTTLPAEALPSHDMAGSSTMSVALRSQTEEEDGVKSVPALINQDGVTHSDTKSNHLIKVNMGTISFEYCSVAEPELSIAKLISHIGINQA